jgi:hypothetical protein
VSRLAVIEQSLAVVGGEDDGAFVPDGPLAQGVEQAAELLVAEADLAVVEVRGAGGVASQHLRDASLLESGEQGLVGVEGGVVRGRWLVGHVRVEDVYPEEERRGRGFEPAQRSLDAGSGIAARALTGLVEGGRGLEDVEAGVDAGAVRQRRCAGERGRGVARVREQLCGAAQALAVTRHEGDLQVAEVRQHAVAGGQARRQQRDVRGQCHRHRRHRVLEQQRLARESVDVR